MQTDDCLAYTDESGNTGSNLFDDSQPNFWSGTPLITEEGAVASRGFVREWCSRLGADGLHGNCLGTRGIDALSGSAASFLRDAGCRLTFARVEKRYLAVTKLADQILDTGLNEAVHPDHYWFRPARYLLTCAIDMNLSPIGQEESWTAFGHGDALPG